MKITDILNQDSIIPNAEAGSKKQLLDMLSELAARQTGLDERLILDSLIERERLGTTGIGHGVALPHTRMGNLKKIFCGFARTTPVDFESVDDKPVDLAFLLLVPEEAGADHLKALARLSRLLRDETVTNELRQAKDAEHLYRIISENDKDE